MFLLTTGVLPIRREKQKSRKNIASDFYLVQNIKTTRYGFCKPRMISTIYKNRKETQKYGHGT